MKPFHDELYYYTANGPSGNKGYVISLQAATEALCPAGRILHATGKKLVPGIHPMSFINGKLNPYPKLLISVYDSVSLLRGFIDPSSTAFVRAGLPMTPVIQADSQPVNQAPAVVNPEPAIVNPQPISMPVENNTNLTEAPEKLYIKSKMVFPAGDYSVTPAEAQSASVGTITNIPGRLTMKINTSSLTQDSMIFLTPLGRGPTLVAVSDIQASIGQFTISAGSVCTVNWMIVN
jgi:hypothetical protein